VLVNAALFHCSEPCERSIRLAIILLLWHDALNLCSAHSELCVICELCFIRLMD